MAERQRQCLERTQHFTACSSWMQSPENKALCSFTSLCSQPLNTVVLGKRFLKSFWRKNKSRQLQPNPCISGFSVSPKIPLCPWSFKINWTWACLSDRFELSPPVWSLCALWNNRNKCICSVCLFLQRFLNCGCDGHLRLGEETLGAGRCMSGFCSAGYLHQLAVVGRRFWVQGTS